MRTTSLLLFAASAAMLPGIAPAQPPAPGVTWQGGHGSHGAQTTVVQHGGPGNVVVRHGGRGQHPGRGFRHHRIGRGGIIPPFWFGPQFHINNWQHYGFAQPGEGRRWVRYYDDAYLIDHGGRVHDERHGLDWDQYGERWRDEDGIPSYYGSNEYEPGDEDYAHAVRHGDREHGEHHAHGHGEAHGGYSYGYGSYGYGYGYAYPIIIETTTYPVTYTEEIIEEVIETRRPRRRARACNCAPRRAAPRPAPRPQPRRAAPRPPAGERG